MRLNTLKPFFRNLLLFFFTPMNTHFASFKDFFDKNLLILFNNVLCYCKAL